VTSTPYHLFSSTTTEKKKRKGIRHTFDQKVSRNKSSPINCINSAENGVEWATRCRWTNVVQPVSGGKRITLEKTPTANSQREYSSWNGTWAGIQQVSRQLVFAAHSVYTCVLYVWPSNDDMLQKQMMQAPWPDNHHVTWPHPLRRHPPDRLWDFNDTLIIDVPDLKTRRTRWLDLWFLSSTDGVSHVFVYKTTTEDGLPLCSNTWDNVSCESALETSTTKM